MPKIAVPVLWDKNNSFLNGSLVNIDTSSMYVTTVLKPNKVYPPAATPTNISTLQIKEPDFGTLYLNMTLAAYQAAISAASGSNSPQIVTKIFNIVATSSTITDATFLGATIVAIWKDGIDINPTGMLSGSTLTFASPLADGDTVGVIYYKN